jgi:predicted transposase YbfD/YdcC
MYCIARQCVLSSLTQEQRERFVAEAALHSLAEVLEAVPDPRKAHGLRYDLPFLLTCLIAALLCNCDGTEAVAGWCRDHVDLLREVFGPRLFLTPCGSLYRWLLPQLDASAIERVLGQWVQATTQAAADEPLALDGKTVRGARAGEQPAPHLLAFVTHQSQETFFQVRVDEKTNEIPVAKQVLPTLPIGQRVCTADALHAHAEFLCLLQKLGADTVLTVKGNQPTLYADLTTYFADPHACSQQAETVDRRRGRIEVRTIKVSTEMNAYLAFSWPGIAQVAQLTRIVTKAGVTTTEVVYLITTLTVSQASPARLLELNRGHWSIENRSHYVRDVSFGEDRSRLRTGNAPQILAACRNLAITLIHRCGSCHIKATRRHFASCPRKALALLTSPQGDRHVWQHHAA